MRGSPCVPETLETHLMIERVIAFLFLRKPVHFHQTGKTSFDFNQHSHDAAKKQYFTKSPFLLSFRSSFTEQGTF